MNPGGLWLMCGTTSAELFKRNQSSMNTSIKQLFFDGVIRCALVFYSEETGPEP